MSSLRCEVLQLVMSSHAELSSQRQSCPPKRPHFHPQCRSLTPHSTRQSAGRAIFSIPVPSSSALISHLEHPAIVKVNAPPDLGARLLPHGSAEPQVGDVEL